jgi:hypothetical protein
MVSPHIIDVLYVASGPVGCHICLSSAHLIQIPIRNKMMVDRLSGGSHHLSVFLIDIRKGGRDAAQ